jgi:hypothetical protein
VNVNIIRIVRLCTMGLFSDDGGREGDFAVGGTCWKGGGGCGDRGDGTRGGMARGDAVRFVDWELRGTALRRVGDSIFRDDGLEGAVESWAGDCRSGMDFRGCSESNGARFVGDPWPSLAVRAVGGGAGVTKGFPGLAEREEPEDGEERRGLGRNTTVLDDVR